jgi:putative CocE/NonD family hydrolase
MPSVQSISLKWGIKIRLRDGVHLSATVYAPTNQGVPGPSVFAMGPYISDGNHQRGTYFAEGGLVFVSVDSRGRGDSEGTFRPFIQEAQDGYDVVEWLARQPYCNGKVAMWGGSYLGYSQWAAAKEMPPHLVTIVPVASAYPGLDFPMRNNIFSPFVMQWLTLTSGRASQKELFSDAGFWSRAYREWHESGRPFRELDTFVGNASSTFQEWLDHPTPDAYWEACTPTKNQLAKLQIPILTITGSYDDDQPGALEYYKQHLAHGSSEARDHHYLIIGPWNHAATRTEDREFGGLTFRSESSIDLPKLHLEWYAWTMQSGPKPAFLKAPVAYYVIGAEVWRYASNLEAVTAGLKCYFLNSQCNANDVLAAGNLQEVPGTGRPDSFTYGPQGPFGLEVEAEEKADGTSLVDQTLTFALRGRQLVYHSEPFEHDTEVSGFFRLSAWISIDCPDTDLYVSVYEVAADGTGIRLSTDAIRARYREGLRLPRLIGTQAQLRYDFNRFTFISRLVRRGSRLRLVIAPMGRLIEATFSEKNYNSGGVVAEESAASGRSVTVRLFHDTEHPSALYVPLGQPT